MEHTWSLSELYESFVSEAFIGDFNRLNNEIENFKRQCDDIFSSNKETREIIEKYLKTETILCALAGRLLDYCELTLSVEAENRPAIKYIELIEQKLTETSVPETKFLLFLKGLSADELTVLTNESPFLKEHAFYLEQAKKKSSYCLTEREERIISKMETTGSLAWIKFQENVMSTIEIDVSVDGETKRLPFPAVRNLAYDKNPKTREAAYNAELKACARAAKSCAAALNGIKGEVITTCELRGYESPLQMTLLDSRMDKETLDALISSMRENLGLFTRYFKKKAELLNKETLAFYDLFAPVGKSGMNYTFSEAADFVVKQFSNFSKELGDYAQKAINRKWIDVYPKAGKRSGAFCQNLHYLKESRFLLNFNGSFNDVLTLAHELGHGYHGSCLYGESLLNSDYPMPIAETASTFCETIVINSALKEASSGNALHILENDISSSAQIIVDILSRYTFESKVFSLREKGSITERELCDIMLEAQKETYLDGLDYNYAHPYMWVVKPHYYSANTNFYNFPYAFGLLFSKGLYAAFLERGDEFVAAYKKMLANSGKMNLRDLAQIAGIDISGAEFWRASFGIIDKEINSFLEM